MLSGKKTYALVILGAISTLALYAQNVITNGFDLGELVKFVNSEAIILAFGTIRAAIAKK